MVLYLKDDKNTSHDDFAWLCVPAEVAAKRLLGSELISTIGDSEVRVRIVETEAYDQADEASHTFKGKTTRNAAMFLGAGHLYVYLTYGMHYCCNVVCGQEGFGAGVLIRAVEPIAGIETVERRRGMTGAAATNGPGKTCQALGITLDCSGHDLSVSPVRLVKKPALGDDLIVSSRRIGISKAVHAIRRFYIKDNLYVSRYKR